MIAESGSIEIVIPINSNMRCIEILFIGYVEWFVLDKQ